MLYAILAFDTLMSLAVFYCLCRYVARNTMVWKYDTMFQEKPYALGVWVFRRRVLYWRWADPSKLVDKPYGKHAGFWATIKEAYFGGRQCL